MDVAAESLETIIREDFMRQLSRRAALAFGAGGAALTIVGWDEGAFAAAKEAADEIAIFTGGKIVAKAKVSIELPEIVENGNTVPLAVFIDAPIKTDMTSAEAKEYGDLELYLVSQNEGLKLSVPGIRH